MFHPPQSVEIQFGCQGLLQMLKTGAQKRLVAKPKAVGRSVIPALRSILLRDASGNGRGRRKGPFPLGKLHWVPMSGSQCWPIPMGLRQPNPHKGRSVAVQRKHTDFLPQRIKPDTGVSGLRDPPEQKNIE